LEGKMTLIEFLNTPVAAMLGAFLGAYIVFKWF
jgi:hypothetical protein